MTCPRCKSAIIIPAELPESITCGYCGMRFHRSFIEEISIPVSKKEKSRESFEEWFNSIEKFILDKLAKV